MRIAVTYLDGKISPAFCRSEYFRLYDIECGKIVSTRVIDNGGYEHTTHHKFEE